MKKIILSLLVLLSMLVSSTGGARAGSIIELISVSSNAGGIVFVFRVSGEFSKRELHGTGQISSGESFEFDCTQKDETTVICHLPKKAGGHNVSITFGGSTFWAETPLPVENSIPSKYCYNFWAGVVYENMYLYFNDEGVLTGIGAEGPKILDGIKNFGPVCQDLPGQEASNDRVDYAYLVFEDGNEVLGVFVENGGMCGNDFGPSFYSILC